MNKKRFYLSLAVGAILYFVFLVTIHLKDLKNSSVEVNPLEFTEKQKEEWLEEVTLENQEFRDDNETNNLHQVPLSFPKPEPLQEILFFETCSLDFDPEFSDVNMDLSDILCPCENIGLSTLPRPELVFSDEEYNNYGPLCGSEDFDLQVEYAAKRFRPGYVFKITLIPRSGAEFKRIHQNYYFVLDRSNSIPRMRYNLNKKAVADALELLHAGDHFNIFIFDSHVVRLSQEPVACTKENLSLARDFLEKQGHGGYFAATELYASLGKIFPSNLPEKEINTAILLSDGDTYLSSELQRVTLGGWTLKNKGKVSLYCVATGPGNNLALMDLLSGFNKGMLIYAGDHRQVGEKLKQLMRTIHNPIGKEIVATAIPKDKQMNIILQPKRQRLPELYQNRPFVVYGSTNRLQDFVLFLQGRYYDRTFDIKKIVSFTHASTGSPSIERQWTSLLAQEFYERFFEDGNVSHLESAKQLLVPLNVPVAFSE